MIRLIGSLTHSKEKSGELLERFHRAQARANQQPSSTNFSENVVEKVQRLTGEEEKTNNPDTSARHSEKNDDIVSSASMIKLQKRRIKSLRNKNMDEYGDLTDVDNGYDFQLVKEDGDMGFPNYKKSKPKKTPSPLFEDSDDIEEVLQNLKDLDKEVEYKSAKELAEILEEFLDTRKATQGLVSGNKSSNEAAARPTTAPRAAPIKKDEEDYDDFEKQLLEDIDEDN